MSRPCIFVFGSNRAGYHGAGAALTAAIHYGAQGGLGEGMVGDSYAIPTKDERLKSLPLTEIRKGVDRFVEFAKNNKELFFVVTAIGCGYAGYTNEQMAPMFFDLPKNCLIPVEWAYIWKSRRPHG